MIDNNKWKQIDEGSKIKYIKSMFEAGDLGIVTKHDWELMCTELLSILDRVEKMNHELCLRLDELSDRGEL